MTFLHYYGNLVTRAYENYFHKAKNRYTLVHWPPCHSLQEKDRLFRLAKRTNLTTHWVVFKVARNAYQASVRRSKAIYLENMSARVDRERSPYQWWRQAKQLTNISKTRAPIPSLESGGEVVTTDASKAHLLADVFSNQCSNTHTQQLPILHPPPTPTSPFDISVISAYDIFDTLKRLPVHKAADGDIPNRILKETAGVIAHSLCKVFNF